ncbi:Oxygen-dependent choline dehydrogenase [Mycena venus]|uniref:Oxygen-dependent choline dehydrogenase n=1 Tax=Mycena venus TaxID=2733690 RepID=A0A8H6YGU9_9AGAR|nr:Oxygen-dependent choline dehydrogenase [Mycena venus]
MKFERGIHCVCRHVVKQWPTTPGGTCTILGSDSATSDLGSSISNPPCRFRRRYNSWSLSPWCSFSAYIKGNILFSTIRSNPILSEMARGDLSTLFPLITLSFLVLQGASLPACPDKSQAAYDFIVVGAGVGGGPVAARLAENGFSVLVVDAGHDVVNLNTTIPFYFGRAVEDPQLELNYTYDEFSPGAKFPRDDTWYPRARALGGSTVHNAMINNIAATGNDFNNLATMFNDSTWSYANMRNYFRRIEHNLYLNNSNPDHGFDGWLKTSLNPASILANPKFADSQLIDIVTTLATSGPTIDDLNSAANDATVGVANPSYTIDENHNRSSVHDRLIAVQKSSTGKLNFALDTLATRVLLCETEAGQAPTAYGVEVARGAALAVASNFNGKLDLKTEVITVRHEVIISAGVFQSPQLLMLSGIGDKDQLSQHGIEPIVPLPGVGANLQGESPAPNHDEVANIWTLKQNHSLFDGCTVLSDPEQDPCLEFWVESGHQNLYSFGAALNMMMLRSSPAQPEPDMMLYWAPAYFPGFVRGFADEIADIHNALTVIALKAHPSSRGIVKLTGNHPQDPLQIEKHHFEASGGQDDIAAIREAIKVARGIVGHPNITQHVEAQVFPAPDGQTDEEIDNHILEHVFGHHACCTNPMGADDDPNAVLDGDFKVRGVNALRVVDISSWPNVPGWFVTTPTYMMAEKAADVIIASTEL